MYPSTIPHIAGYVVLVGGLNLKLATERLIENIPKLSTINNNGSSQGSSKSQSKLQCISKDLHAE